jgi:hypothetical protein
MEFDMENYDQRRRQMSDERHRSRQGYDEQGERESWREGSREAERPRRAERGWLDYDRDYGRSDERQRREEQRYGQSGETERSRFSPDWSREGEEPRRSDDQYYSRNRDRGDDYSRRQRSGRDDDDRRNWEQRSRTSMPREQYEMAERSEPGDYYDPDWPYQRGGRGREQERSREDEQQRHYRGYYSRSARPFAYPGGSGYLLSESWTLHGPYTGRGPKGYKRSDQQITEEACQRLERDGEIDASDIEVGAEDGVIRLRGTVQDRASKRRAEECVESIYGVSDVMNELRVARQDEERSQGGQSWQGTQSDERSQGAQTSRSSQSSTAGAQASQASIGSPASQAAQGAQSPGARTGGSGSASDEERKRH